MTLKEKNRILFHTNYQRKNYLNFFKMFKYKKKFKSYLKISEEFNVSNELNELKKKGIIKNFYLKQDEVKELENYFSKKINVPGLSQSKNSKYKFRYFFYFLEKLKNLVVSYTRLRFPRILQKTFFSRDIILAPHILEILTNKDLNNLIKSYMGVNPILSHFNISYNYPAEINSINNSTDYHRDHNCYNSVLLLLYLSDVETEDKGPHEYVQYSHDINNDENLKFNKEFENNQKIKELKKQNYKLYLETNKNEIIERFGNNVIKNYGQKGWGFLEDSYGLHKGNLPTKKNYTRKVFWAVYTMMNGHSYYSNHLDNGDERNFYKKMKFTDIKDRINLSNENKYLLKNFFED